MAFCCAAGIGSLMAAAGYGVAIAFACTINQAPATAAHTADNLIE
jgi:hypothetical protein